MEEKDLLTALRAAFPASVLETGESLGDPFVLIRPGAVREVMGYLQAEPWSFAMLLDLTCVDYPDRAGRFEMIYHVFSPVDYRRLRIKAVLPAKDAEVDSLTALWKNADWLEREVYDMFGVRFAGHPDLRRLLMYDGFEGHPLRKDYPLRKRQPLLPPRETP
jgi:NADH-quinone oxidoreductase subunit C